MVPARPHAFDRLIMRLARARRPFHCFACGCRRRLRVALAVVLLFAAAPAASASSIALHITDGTNFVTVFDNLAGDGDTEVSTIAWGGIIGAWRVTVAAGTGEFAPGMTPGSMDLTYNVATTAATPTTLTMFLTQYDMSTDYPGWLLEIAGTFIGNGLSLTYDAFADDGNNPFAMTSQLGGALGPFTAGFLASGIGSAPIVPMYSLTQRLTFGSTGAGRATGDAALIALPEPASLIFVGSGLLALARRARRAHKPQ